MSATVNCDYLWPILEMEAKHVNANAAQLEAIDWMKSLVSHRDDLNPMRFADLQVVMVEDILSITITECSDTLQPIINGHFMRLAIEEDGYTVLTGSNLPTPVTGRPVTPGSVQTP